MSMSYDAARGVVVVFGGEDPNSAFLGDTWTWDGQDWTKRSPAHSPSARELAAMADDPNHARVVLFGGLFSNDETWTWNGSDWSERSPAHAPTARYGAVMTDDGSSGDVLLFGGSSGGDETWTWDGTDWTRQAPEHFPCAREFGFGLAFDAAHGNVVLFGGNGGGGIHHADIGDTWTWDGADWRIPFAASIRLTPNSGPPGTTVSVHGWAFGAYRKVLLFFIDANSGTMGVGRARADASGAIARAITIPSDATMGAQTVKATARPSGQVAKRTFTVT
jgi:hypothetical protein